MNTALQSSTGGPSLQDNPQYLIEIEEDLTLAATREDYAQYISILMDHGTIQGKKDDAMFYVLQLERSGLQPCSISAENLERLIKTYATMHQAHCVLPYGDDD